MEETYTSTHCLIAYIVSHFPRGVTKTFLMKLLFECDLRHYRAIGRQITDLHYIRYKHGPWSPLLDDVLRSMELHEISHIPVKNDGGKSYDLYKPGPAPRVHDGLEPLQEKTASEVCFIFEGANLATMLQVVNEEIRIDQFRMGQAIDFARLVAHETRPRTLADVRAKYGAVVNSIDFSEHGDPEEAAAHAQEVWEELAEVRKRANATGW